MDFKEQTIFNEIAGQRNYFADMAANFVGDLAERDALILSLKTEVEHLKKLIENDSDKID